MRPSKEPPPSGASRAMPCATCHVDNDYKKYTCYGCHEHTLANVTRKHRKHVKERIQNFENCVQCHRSVHDKPREGRERGRGRD
jgi:hypothetical protein